MLHGPPWVYSHSHCHQMITQQRPKGPGGVVGGHPNIVTLQPSHGRPGGSRASADFAHFSAFFVAVFFRRLCPSTPEAGPLRLLHTTNYQSKGGGEGGDGWAVEGVRERGIEADDGVARYGVGLGLLPKFNQKLPHLRVWPWPRCCRSRPVPFGVMLSIPWTHHPLPWTHSWPHAALCLLPATGGTPVPPPPCSAAAQSFCIAGFAIMHADVWCESADGRAGSNMTCRITLRDDFGALVTVPGDCKFHICPLLDGAGISRPRASSPLVLWRSTSLYQPCLLSLTPSVPLPVPVALPQPVSLLVPVPLPLPLRMRLCNLTLSPSI